MMHMRTTLNLNDALLDRARSLSGIEEKTALLHAGLEALIGRASARRLAELGEDDEALAFIETHRLMGAGIGWVDVHILAATVLARGRLWTTDRRLERAAARLGIAASIRRRR